MPVVSAKPQWSPSPASSLRRLTCSKERSRSPWPLLLLLQLEERSHLPPLPHWYAGGAVCVRRGKRERERGSSQCNGIEESEEEEEESE